MFTWQLYTQFFASSYIWLAYIFCGSLLGNTLQYFSPWDIKEVVRSKLRETFLAPVLCFDKYQRRIQNPVGFNSFEPLTISAGSYFLVAWLMSEYPSEYYYVNRFNWCFLFFVSWYLLAFILDLDPMINKALIIMLITDPLSIAELSYLLHCSCFYLE